MALVKNFGVLLPTRGVLVYADRGGPRVELTWQMAETAERLGYDSVWVGDSITSKPRLEPLTAMAAIAARTNRVKVGTAVLLNALRHPVHLAHAAATIDNNNVSQRAFYHWLKDAYGHRFPKLQDHARLVRRLYTQLHWTGRFLPLSNQLPAPMVTTTF